MRSVWDGSNMRKNALKAFPTLPLNLVLSKSHDNDFMHMQK